MNEFDRITIDPEVCLGQPTIRGMRITVSIILKQIASGMTTQEILEAYPELEEEDITQAQRKRKLIWTVTGVSLILGLVLCHFFYLDLWVLTARLLRLADKYT